MKINLGYTTTLELFIVSKTSSCLRNAPLMSLITSSIFEVTVVISSYVVSQDVGAQVINLIADWNADCIKITGEGDPRVINKLLSARDMLSQNTSSFYLGTPIPFRCVF